MKLKVIIYSADHDIVHILKPVIVIQCLPAGNFIMKRIKVNLNHQIVHTGSDSNKGNSYETWESSLLYVFVGFFFGVDPAHNLAKYKKWLCTCMFIQLTNRNIAVLM